MQKDVSKESLPGRQKNARIEGESAEVPEGKRAGSRETYFIGKKSFASMNKYRADDSRMLGGFVV